MNINPNLKSGQRPCKHQKDTQWTRNEKRETKHECERYTNSSFRVLRIRTPAYSVGGHRRHRLCVLSDWVMPSQAKVMKWPILTFSVSGWKRKVSNGEALFRSVPYTWVCVCASKRLHEKGKLFVVWADCRYRVKVDAVGGFWAFVTFHRINKSNYGKWKTIRSVHLFYSVFSLRHTYHKHILAFVWQSGRLSVCVCMASHPFVAVVLLISFYLFFWFYLFFAPAFSFVRPFLSAVYSIRMGLQ